MKRARNCFGIFMFGIMLSFSNQSLAQDYSWWNARHNWDGITHWTRYMILSPAFLGPNALPVPGLRPGLIDTTLNWELAGEVYRSKGDHTEDIFTSLHIPVAHGLAALKLEMVVWEHYKMDTLTRDERRARDEDGEGYSIGDLLISTNFRIIRNKQSWPDMNLGIHIRTATGSNKSGARFCDTPGYYFDLAMSKRFQMNGKSKTVVEPYAIIGFYAWQVSRDDNMQNDALLYGAGINFKKKDHNIATELAGYHGYFNNGDRPMVIRIKGQLKISPAAWLSLRLQQGLHDFPYTSLRLGIILKSTDIRCTSKHSKLDK